MPTAVRKRKVQNAKCVMQLTSVFDQNLAAYLDGKRRAMNWGGTYSSKTISILQCCILIAQAATQKKENLIISVVSESLPHLKLGAIRDFFNIMGVTQEDPRWSKTSFTFTFSEYASIEFFGADDVGKAHGPRRQILFINEANNVPWETAKNLDMRTEKFTFCDWNPTSEFWAHEYESVDGTIVKGWMSEPDTVNIHSTYLDALDVIPESKVRDIEAWKDKDPATWSIYGLGELAGGSNELVYPLFQQVDALPAQGEVGYGLDFGFSEDPTVLTQHVLVGGNLYSKELIYERGLTNDAIARKMDLLEVSKSLPIFADAAEPKSIEEIRQKGFNILPTEKGPGSVEYGIQKVKQYYQFWTKDSLDCIKEQRNFRYIRDRATGRLTDRTTHQWSHGLDSRRYFLAGKRLSGPINVRPISSLHFSPVYGRTPVGAISSLHFGRAY